MERGTKGVRSELGGWGGEGEGKGGVEEKI